MGDKQQPHDKGLAARNNPLGQRMPSGHVGPDGKDSTLEHGQSAELVDEIRQHAHEIEGEGTPSKTSSKKYDPKGPARQPGKVVKQKDIDALSGQKKQGQYTQDNEEETAKD